VTQQNLHLTLILKTGVLVPRPVSLTSRGNFVTRRTVGRWLSTTEAFKLSLYSS